MTAADIVPDAPCSCVGCQSKATLRAEVDRLQGVSRAQAHASGVLRANAKEHTHAVQSMGQEIALLRADIATAARVHAELVRENEANADARWANHARVEALTADLTTERAAHTRTAEREMQYVEELSTERAAHAATRARLDAVREVWAEYPLGAEESWNDWWERMTAILNTGAGE